MNLEINPTPREEVIGQIDNGDIRFFYFPTDENERPRGPLVVEDHVDVTYEYSMRSLLIQFLGGTDMGIGTLRRFDDRLVAIDQPTNVTELVTNSEMVLVSSFISQLQAQQQLVV